MQRDVARPGKPAGPRSFDLYSPCPRCGEPGFVFQHLLGPITNTTAAGMVRATITRECLACGATWAETLTEHPAPTTGRVLARGVTATQPPSCAVLCDGIRIPLHPSSAVHPRVDLLLANGHGVYRVQAGVPAACPVPPEPDPVHYEGLQPRALLHRPTASVVLLNRQIVDVTCYTAVSPKSA